MSTNWSTSCTPAKDFRALLSLFVLAICRELPGTLAVEFRVVVLVTFALPRRGEVVAALLKFLDFFEPLFGLGALLRQLLGTAVELQEGGFRRVLFGRLMATL